MERIVILCGQVCVCHCVVPENIHTSPMEGVFFSLNPHHPTGNSILVQPYFPLKNWAFKTPLPLGTNINLPILRKHGGDIRIYLLKLVNNSSSLFNKGNHIHDGAWIFDLK